MGHFYFDVTEMIKNIDKYLKNVRINIKYFI